MHHFDYRNCELYCEDVPVEKVAGDLGTPLYLYSYATVIRHFEAFDGSFGGVPHLTCFSVKSNSNLAVLKLFAAEGGGADIVSGGELHRCLAAGIGPEKIVYSGVGKSAGEMAYALESGILMFNVESVQEMRLLDRVAGEMGAVARIAFRVNPDVDPQTHPYISTGLRENKFGVDIREAPEQYRAAAELDNLEVTGVSCHIGSQLTKISPFVDALKKLKELVSVLRSHGHSIRYLDLGGGLGIRYSDEVPPDPGQYARALKDEMGDMGLVLIFEPGRVIMGNAGALVTRVLYTKSTPEKNFVVVDAAMNDLMRPSLYDSYHGIQPVRDSGRVHPSEPAPATCYPLPMKELPPIEVDLDALRRHLASRGDLRAAWLFGSRGRGDAGARSDVDLAVWFTERPQDPLRAILELSADLARHLEVPIAAIDLLDIDEAPALVRQAVFRDGRLLVDRDPEARAVLQVRTLPEAEQARRLWEVRRQVRARQLAENG